MVFDPDELAELAPASTKTVDIEDFVALSDIDPIYFERTFTSRPTAKERPARTRSSPR